MRTLLSGNSIRLTAIKESDLATIENWFQDAYFLRFYDFLPAIPKQTNEVKEYLDTFTNTQERFIFTLRLQETDECIGLIGFDDILWSHGVATIFIGIGEKRFQNQGFGKEALQLLLDFGFQELNFHRIQLYVISYNEAAIELYQSSGFVKEGSLRNFIKRDGKRHDMLIYSLLADEWNKTR